MKRFMMVIALTFVLSGFAIAGEIPTVGYAPPQTPVANEIVPSTAPGDIPSTDHAPATIQEELLKVILGILSVVG